MATEFFQDINFKSDSLDMIARCNAVIDEYQAQGFVLTLRQLYYQMVARDIIPNTLRSYKNLGELVVKARLAGKMDWDAIEDRTRNLARLASWDGPSEIIDAVARQYREDLWADQPHYVEVWIEKEALVGTIAATCDELRVPYFACRGYTSVSELYGAGKRFEEARVNGREPVILHLGDHDPSGIDMTRDNRERTALFAYGDVLVERLALNGDQIRRYNPPPNSAKATDSRFTDYARRFGDSSWELDALEPSVINQLIRDAVAVYRDDDTWDAAVERERERRRELRLINRHYDVVANFARKYTGGYDDE